MKIINNNYQTSYLKELAESFAKGEQNIKPFSNFFNNKQEVDVFISEEGQTALRENLKKLGTGTEYTDISEIQIGNTNEVAMEHYAEMGKISSFTLKDGKYDVNDVSESIMEAYETVYNQIIEKHKNGDRHASYSLTGDVSISLEEDLAGLNDAFQMRLSGLKGYITCQQTNKAFENPARSIELENKKSYSYFDDEYQKNAIAMMEQAQKEFLDLARTLNYRKNSAASIISKIMKNNQDFMHKTNLLFPKNKS